MKQKVLLLMVLALGMCGTVGFAQEKEYNVGGDGFEWYEVGSSHAYGALDKYGKVILPNQFDAIFYEEDRSSASVKKGFFKVKKNEKYGAYNTKGQLIIPIEYDLYINRSQDYDISVKKGAYEGRYNIFGKCLIPISRRYKWILPMEKYYICYFTESEVKGLKAICDASGNEVFRTKQDCNYVNFIDVMDGKYAIVIDNKYFVDIRGNILYECEEITYEWPDGDVNTIRIKKTKNSQYRPLTAVEKAKVILKGNPLGGNKEYFASCKREFNQQNSITNYTSSYPSPTQSSSSPKNSNSNSNDNSSQKTTTVVVEHHHDPVPVQQWQACFACGGMGTMGCTNCGGSGTKYIGDRLHRCSRCNGQGIIPCNVCYGNKGQYVTVYK